MHVWVRYFLVHTAATRNMPPGGPSEHDRAKRPSDRMATIVAARRETHPRKPSKFDGCDSSPRCVAETNRSGDLCNRVTGWCAWSARPGLCRVAPSPDALNLQKNHSLSLPCQESAPPESEPTPQLLKSAY